MRFGGAGRGKRGGLRVIWYVASERVPILALLIYGKNEQADLTPEQREAVLALADQIRRSR